MCFIGRLDAENVSTSSRTSFLLEKTEDLRKGKVVWLTLLAN